MDIYCKIIVKSCLQTKYEVIQLVFNSPITHSLHSEVPCRSHCCGDVVQLISFDTFNKLYCFDAALCTWKWGFGTTPSAGEFSAAVLPFCWCPWVSPSVPYLGLDITISWPCLTNKKIQYHSLVFLTHNRHCAVKCMCEKALWRKFKPYCLPIFCNLHVGKRMKEEGLILAGRKDWLTWL